MSPISARSLIAAAAVSAAVLVLGAAKSSAPVPAPEPVGCSCAELQKKFDDLTRRVDALQVRVEAANSRLNDLAAGDAPAKSKKRRRSANPPLTY